jgi:hypothetical protein
MISPEGDKKLVFANHFFWKPGTPLQRSLTGLLRSLLHDTLKICPDLIPSVLPSQWKELGSTPWQVPTELQSDKNEIRRAFSRLMEQRDLYKNHSFCYFIDGLDEYEETHQDDYRVMADLLRSWVLTTSHVKLCVSSREYNVFNNAFSEERRLCLQDLTRRDMERYVRDKLKDCHEKELRDITQQIVNKGNGIFLWVALVVKSLRERLEDGHKLSALNDELDSLPEELEDLFQYLLMSLSRAARKKAYEIFDMVSNLRQWGASLPLLAYSFLPELEKDPTFAVQESFQFLDLDPDTKEMMLARARGQVNGYCKGLVEFSFQVHVEAWRDLLYHQLHPSFHSRISRKTANSKRHEALPQRERCPFSSDACRFAVENDEPP